MNRHKNIQELQIKMDVELPQSIHWNLRKIILNYVIKFWDVFDRYDLTLDQLIWFDSSIPMKDEEYISHNELHMCMIYRSKEITEWLNKRIQWPAKCLESIGDNIHYIAGEDRYIDNFLSLARYYDKSSFKFGIRARDIYIRAYVDNVSIQSVGKLITYFGHSNYDISALIIRMVEQKDIDSIHYIQNLFSLSISDIYEPNKTRLADLCNFNVLDWLHRNFKNGCKSNDQNCIGYFY